MSAALNPVRRKAFRAVRDARMMKPIFHFTCLFLSSAQEGDFAVRRSAMCRQPIKTGAIDPYFNYRLLLYVEACQVNFQNTHTMHFINGYGDNPYQTPIGIRVITVRRDTPVSCEARKTVGAQ